jgi:hypothetical protein
MSKLAARRQKFLGITFGFETRSGLTCLFGEALADFCPIHARIEELFFIRISLCVLP